MKHLLFFLCIIVSVIQAIGQSNPTEKVVPIIEEGMNLYRLEKASWVGTDVFLEKYPNRANIGGYFSYPDGDSTVCVFFSKGDTVQVIGAIHFDSTHLVPQARIQIEEREFTSTEFDYYQLRNAGIAIIGENKDDFFQFYNNTNYNVIPFINGGEKKFYILTAPKTSGLVLFGNDYLLTFDANYTLLSKKMLHANLIPIEYGNETEQVEVTIHSHLPETGDFITATDICTLMLYAEYTQWKYHNVVSEKYVNIWNCKENTLGVVTVDSLDKIDKKSEKQKKKKEKEK